MSNELTTHQGNFLATEDDFLSRLTEVAEGIKTGGSNFLKMDGNSGQYSYGADDIELPIGSHLVMNHRSFEEGWIIWVGGEVVHQEMTNIEQGRRKPKTQLPDHGPYSKDDGPREQMTVQLRMLDEPHAEMIFQANNKSKLSALGALLKDFVRAYKSHPGMYAIIEIDSNSFEAKDPLNPKRKFKKYAPKFKIVDWMSADELAALSEGAPEDYESEEGYEDETAALPAPEAEEVQPEVEEAPPAPAQPQQRTRPAPARNPAPSRPAAAPTTAPAAKPAAAPTGNRRTRF